MAVRIRELNRLRKHPGILTAGLLILLCGVFVVSLVVGDANVHILKGLPDQVLHDGQEIDLTISPK